MKNIKNVRTLSVKFLCPTNTKGARTKINDTYFKDSKTLSYDYKFSDIKDQAVDYLQSKGFIVLTTSFWKPDECLITVDNFSPNCLNLKGESRD